MTKRMARCSGVALLAAAMAWLVLAPMAKGACNAPNGVLYGLNVTLDVQDFYCAGEDATINVTVTAVPTVPGTTPIPYPNPTYYWSALGPGPTGPGSTLISGSGTASFGAPFSITLPAAELFVSSTPNDWHINIVVQNAPDQYAGPCVLSLAKQFTITAVDLDSFVAEPGSEPGDPETMVLGYDKGRVTYNIEPPGFTADTAELKIKNRNDALVFKTDLTGKTGGVTYTYDWDGKWNQSPNDSPAIYTKPDNGPYKAQITITKGSPTCDSNEDSVKTKGNAIVESAFDPHHTIMKTKLESLGFDDVHVDMPQSKANAIAKVPLRLVFYALTHGAHNDPPTEFVGLELPDVANILRHTDLPAALAYELVFMNCCQSNLDPNRNNFKTKLGARAYIGWDGDPLNFEATAAANTVMDSLLSDLRIYQAYLAAYDDALVSGAKLRFAGDGSQKLNLK